MAVDALGPYLFRRDFAMEPNSVRCDFSVTYFCSPPFKYLFTGHWSDKFRDPINCCFTS
jgi:hypothetical protein